MSLRDLDGLISGKNSSPDSSLEAGKNRLDSDAGKSV
jgi:hypothetical protein